MISILFAFISFSFSQCPSYDDVTIIQNGSDDEKLYKKQNIYSCGNSFKKNLETTDCRILIYDCTFTIRVATKVPTLIVLKKVGTF